MQMHGSIALESLAAVSEKVKVRKVSPVELVQECLNRIDRYDAAINAFISIYAEEAIECARDAEQEIVHGQWRGPLHGIPIAVKDLIDVAGKTTTAGSALLVNNVAAEDADAVKALRGAGAIIIGKNNLHEFAYGGSGVISYFGVVRNPKDTARIAGGSSSGSSAAVAEGFCYAAVGTDTAGSIRLPAACCGVVGLKPAFGRVSARGVVPLSWSYDHVGPIARTVEDASLVYGALVGSWKKPHSGGKLRIGVAREFFFDGVAEEIAKDVEAAIARLSEEGHLVREVKVPVDEDRIVSSAESWAFHKQYTDRAELYQPQTLQRIRAGEKYTAEQFDVKRDELRRLRASAAELFREVDVIVTPTVAIPPPLLAELEAYPEKLRPTELLMLRNTRPWNVYGVPAISVPCGGWAALQIAGLREETVLEAAQRVERE
jgi:Asp-tRNA(Asn)/Glu-tRNA(Gln) amidotransferase A subunit family amidase